MMKILSASSTIINSEKAAEEVIKTLLAEQVSPQLLLVYHTVSHTASSIYKQLKLGFPDAGILACSTCNGAITETECIEVVALRYWRSMTKQAVMGLRSKTFWNLGRM